MYTRIFSYFPLSVFFSLLFLSLSLRNKDIMFITYKRRAEGVEVLNKQL